MNAKIDMSNVILRSERLTLRPWTLNDVDDLYEYAHVDGVGQMAGWLPHNSVEESRERVKHFIDEKHTFAIEFYGKVIGSLGIDKYSENELPEFQSQLGAEIGYVLAKDYWGRGLIPEAIKAVTQYLFDKVNLDFIVCGHFAENNQSRRAQEKCGFKHYKTTTFTTQLGEVKEGWISIFQRPEHKQ